MIAMMMAKTAIFVPTVRTTSNPSKYRISRFTIHAKCTITHIATSKKITSCLNHKVVEYETMPWKLIMFQRSIYIIDKSWFVKIHQWSVYYVHVLVTRPTMHLYKKQRSYYNPRLRSYL